MRSASRERFRSVISLDRSNVGNHKWARIGPKVDIYVLSEKEKNYLYDIIAALIGEDSSIKAFRGMFDENTVVVVESMVAANSQCNAIIKELVQELLGARANLSKCWLKKVLKASKKVISRSTFKGYGCLETVKGQRRQHIMTSGI